MSEAELHAAGLDFTYESNYFGHVEIIDLLQCGGAEEKGDGGLEEAKPGKRPRKTKWTIDTGTLHGAGSQMARNNERAYALFHEGKRWLAKLLKDAEGFSADSFLKPYDRDDFDNTVLTAGSQFSNEQPWFALFITPPVK